MKKHACGLILILAILLPYVIFAADPIRLATLNWEPYVGEKLGNQGFSTEIVTSAFKIGGYEVQIDFLPWPKALEAIKKGEYDALYPMYYSDKNAEAYALSIPIHKGAFGFYKRTDKRVRFRNLMDLRRYRVGLNSGYLTMNEINVIAFPKRNVVTDDRANLANLLNGSVDIAILDIITARYLLTTSFPESLHQIEFLRPPLGYKSLHVGFSRQKPHLKTLEDFNNALSEMFRMGIVDNIMKKHRFE